MTTKEKLEDMQATEEKNRAAVLDWNVCITPKGLAVMAAIDAGLLLPDADGNIETAAFDKSWELFTDGLTRQGHGLYHHDELSDLEAKLRKKEAFCRRAVKRQALIFFAQVAVAALGIVVVGLLKQ